MQESGWGNAFGGAVRALEGQPHCDDRGRLLEIDLADLPFGIKRVFMVSDAPKGTRRGGHRHRVGYQALFCVAGRIEVGLRKGRTHAEFTLTPDTPGLCIAAGVWADQLYEVEGSVLLVLASEEYDLSSYESDH